MSEREEAQEMKTYEIKVRQFKTDDVPFAIEMVKVRAATQAAAQQYIERILPRPNFEVAWVRQIG